MATIMSLQHYGQEAIQIKLEIKRILKAMTMNARSVYHYCYTKASRKTLHTSQNESMLSCFE